MKGNFKAPHAMALLTTTAIAAEESDAIEKWQKFVSSQMDDLARQERLIPRRAIAIGLALHAVKASLKHGQFEAWKKQMLTRLTYLSESSGRVYASYYMRAAIAFVEETKASKAEIAAVAAGGLVLDLTAPKGPAAALFKRLDDWCGERSLNEILVDLGIKGGSSGGGGSSSAGSGNADAGDTSAEWLLNLRTTYLDPEKAKIFPAAHHKQVLQQAASFVEEYRKMLRAMNVL